ncbi:MAG: hypothetical protein ACYDCQ_18825 [Dehalococcoidia bacterium]
MPLNWQRRQTLGALLDWSCNLLAEVARAMLRRLSVFRGECRLEAVERVCGGDGIEIADALDLLTSLIEKSLVVADFPRGQARYRLLESVREYAAATLDADGEAIPTRHRHTDWYLAFARNLEAGTKDSPHQLQLDAPQHVVEEFHNQRVAFEWSLTDGQRRSSALALCNALWWFWPYHTLLTEGRTWYARSLAAVPDAEPGHARTRWRRPACWRSWRKTTGWGQRWLGMRSTWRDRSSFRCSRLGACAPSR